MYYGHMKKTTPPKKRSASAAQYVVYCAKCGTRETTFGIIRAENLCFQHNREVHGNKYFAFYEKEN